MEQTIQPALLTANPPVGISTRPTAVIPSVGPERSISAYFTSSSSIKKANSYSNIHNNSTNKPNEPQQHITSSSSSAFQPINSSHNTVQKQSTTKPVPILMDIPQHKPLECGQRLKRVHVSHPRSPSIVHVNLN